MKYHIDLMKTLGNVCANTASENGKVVARVEEHIQNGGLPFSIP